MKNYLYKIIIAVSFFFAGCEDEGVNVDDQVIPEKDVSYAVHIQPIFNYHCTACHNNQTAEAGLDLTSYGTATANPDIIFPYEPDNSHLVWAIEGRAGIAFMPPVGSPYKPLSLNQINGIKTWIDEGARAN